MANPPQKTPPSSRLTVSSLLSPPEMKRTESFNSSIGTYQSFTSVSSQQSQPAMTTDPTTPTRVYASPPISPYDRNAKPELDSRRDSGVRDPQLFVPSDASAIAHDGPLFPKEPIEPAADQLISQHMASPEFANLKSKPTREEYELATSFVSTVYKSYNKDPQKWWRQERAFDKRYPPAGIRKKKATPAKSTLKNLAPAPSSTPRRQKVALPRLPRAPRAKLAKKTPKRPAHQSFDHDTPIQNPVAPKPVREKREDNDFTKVTDYSPPLDALGDNPKALKTDWKGIGISLDNDPDRHLLHEAEVHLASTLRLSCAQYLTSKRRIFERRIENLNIGKEFRRTDAQQACKIDVNKASRLHQAFEKVGWFRPELFQQYIKPKAPDS